MKFLDKDPITGVTTYFEHDFATKKNILMEVQDIEPIINRNKFESTALNKKSNWWKVGEVPNSVLVKWAQESGTKIYSKEFQEYAKKQLNSSEYRKFNVNKIKL